MSDDNISRLRNQVMAIMGGSYVLVSMKPFEVDGQQRTRITVRKPRGKKLHHLVQYENGVVR
jgi:hypothetical protein